MSTDHAPVDCSHLAKRPADNLAAMSTSRLFMVRISTGAEPFEATARCVEHEPIRHFTDPPQLLDFLR